MASLPAWKLVDPLPVLGSLGSKNKHNDDQSLEDLVEQGNIERDRDDDLELDGNHSLLNLKAEDMVA